VTRSFMRPEMWAQVNATLNSLTVKGSLGGGGGAYPNLYI
jgi:hypothetical protein